MMRCFCLIIAFGFVAISFAVAGEFDAEAVLAPYVRRGEMSGFVTAVADVEKILQLDAVGYRHFEAKDPMRTDTLFWVASQSKPIAAAAVMILVDDGKLSPDEALTTYLPEFAEARILHEKSERQTVLVPLERQPTLRQLLSHTSGMDWGATVHRKFGFDILSYAEEACVFPAVPFVSQPGTKSLYSNMGINTAAMVVERVSEKPYEKFLKERLFEPLGMNDTTFWPDLDRLAKPYRYDKESKKLVEAENTRFSHPLDDPRRRPDAAAGLFSTAEDMVKFYQMLLGNGVFRGKRILSEAAVVEITKKQTGELPQNYGLGMAIHGDGYGHGGTFGTLTLTVTAKKRILAYMTQQHGLPKAQEAQDAFFKPLR